MCRKMTNNIVVLFGQNFFEHKSYIKSIIIMLGSTLICLMSTINIYNYIDVAEFS